MVNGKSYLDEAEPSVFAFVLRLDRLETLDQITHNLRRFPFVSAIQLEELTVRADHHGAQRMDYLILSGFCVMKIAQAKELGDAFHFVRASGGELPVPKSLV